MADPIKTFVVLDAGAVNQAELERALPRTGEVEIVGMVDGVDAAWVSFALRPRTISSLRGVLEPESEPGSQP